jgi:SSS family solute:Na+ symporter
VNTFQTLVFMTLGAVTLVVIFQRMGGVAVVMARIAEARPELLARGDLHDPVRWLTYSLVPLSAGMFPHLFMHWLSARRVEAFRLTLVAYPICVAIVWLPAVLLGVAGTLDFPGLVGGQSNAILVQMISLHAPGVLAGLLGAGVFAAVMSSLDSQVLALGTMFTEDIVKHHGYADRMTDRQEILTGRIFVGTILALTYGISLLSTRSIFALATWSFSGFAALLPIAIAAFYWRRSTWQGAMASVGTVAVLWLALFWREGGSGSTTVGGTGIEAVAVLLGASAAAMVVVSLLTAAPDPQRVARFFPAGP